MAGADRSGDEPRDEPGGAARATGAASGSDVYRFLFEQNPTPMWIYEIGTLRFLEVNETATRRYGYTRDEFLAMTIADIRPAEDLPRLNEMVRDHPAFSQAEQAAWLQAFAAHVEALNQPPYELMHFERLWLNLLNLVAALCGKMRQCSRMPSPPIKK